MKWPTSEQVEKYLEFADAELGPECTEEWVETIRRILHDLTNGRAKIIYGVELYQWGGGSGSKCKGGCLWNIIEGAGDMLSEKCVKCGTVRTVSTSGAGFC